MNRKNSKLKLIGSLILIFSTAFGNLHLTAQDLVPNDELSLGSSVFVFRQSRKKPQFKSTSRSYFFTASSSGRTAPRRISNQNFAAKYRRKSARVKANSAMAVSNQTRRRRQAAQNKSNKLSDALTAQADALLEENETDKAIETYQQALKNNPKNQAAKLGLSAANVAKGDEVTENGGAVEAKTFYEEAVKFNDANDQAYVKLALIDEKFNFQDEALANYEKALKINPALSELFAPIGNLYFEKGDLATAEIYLAKAEKISKDDAETIFLRGLLNWKRNENDKALAAFTKVLELDPNKAEVYFYQAEIYDRLNQQSKAVAAYQKSVEVDPNYTEAWFDLGVAEYNQGNYEKAADAYQQVIVLDAENPAAHANLASTYRQLERFADANGEYKLAAQTIKTDADLFSEWGFCLGKADEWDKAIARLQTAENLTSDAIDFTNLGWGYYNAARKDAAADLDDEAQANYARGKEVLQKAVELSPKFDAAYLNLGITYTGLRDFDNAVETLTKANNLHQNWLIAVNELGVAYRRSNKLTDAISQFEKTIRLDDKFAIGYFNLGEAQNKLGRRKEARKTYEQLKQLDPKLAAKLDGVLKGAILDETEQQIRKRIPRLPF